MFTCWLLILRCYSTTILLSEICIWKVSSFHEWHSMNKHDATVIMTNPQTSCFRGSGLLIQRCVKPEPGVTPWGKWYDSLFISWQHTFINIVKRTLCYMTMCLLSSSRSWGDTRLFAMRINCLTKWGTLRHNTLCSNTYLIWYRLMTWHTHVAPTGNPLNKMLTTERYHTEQKASGHVRRL